MITVFLAKLAAAMVTACMALTAVLFAMGAEGKSQGERHGE